MPSESSTGSSFFSRSPLRSRIHILWIASALSLVGALSCFAAETRTVTLRWQPPESGCDHYRLEIVQTDDRSPASTANMAFYTRENSLAVPVEDGAEYIARVQAIDRYGARSEFSGYTRFTAESSFEGELSGLPREYALAQNSPNPFNPSTAIAFSLPRESRVRLHVYNIAGQKVATLVDGVLGAGTHTAVWNASEYSSGTYFYSLSAGDFNAVSRMTLVK